MRTWPLSGEANAVFPEGVTMTLKLITQMMRGQERCSLSFRAIKRIDIFL